MCHVHNIIAISPTRHTLPLAFGIMRTSEIVSYFVRQGDIWHRGKDDFAII